MIQRLRIYTASAGPTGSIPVCPQREKRREREGKKILIEISLILVRKDIFIFISVNLEMKNT